MDKVRYILFSLSMAANILAADQTLPATLVSLSPQIFPATAEDPLTDLEWTSALSSVGNPNALNHELMIATEDHGYSHEGTFVMQNPFDFEPFLLPFVLDIPLFEDANTNGLEDFFDLDMAVEGIQTFGAHPNGQGGAEEFFATWSRPAGDAVGTVVVQFPFFGLRFEHAYQLLNYHGSLDFSREGSNVTGNLSLTNTVDVADRILGPLRITVVSTNTLNYAATNWNNGSGLDYVVVTNIMVERAGTNFISYWQLEDGFFASGDQDYVDWILILKGRDADGNGEVDLVEGGFNTEGPRIEMVRLPDATMELTIHGTVGERHVLESATELGIWEDLQVITLNSPVQTVNIPNASEKRFYRLRQL